MFFKLKTPNALESSNTISRHWSLDCHCFMKNIFWIKSSYGSFSFNIVLRQGRIEVKKGRRSVVSVVWALERAGCETGFSSPACSPPAPVLVLPLVCSPVKVLDQGGEAKLLITGTSQTRRTTRERPGKLIGLSVNPSQWLCLPGPSLVWVSLFQKVTSLFVPAFLWDCDKCFQLQRGCFPKHPAGLPCHLRHPDAWIQIFFHVERRPDWQDGGNWGSVGGI